MRPRVLKCVVWDLDDTLWTGTLGEGDAVGLRQEAATLVRQLDERGVLQSIASRNDERALAMLADLGLRDVFLVPQVGAMAKSSSLANIARALDVALDALVFIDDDPFERAEVESVHPEVVCLDARGIADLLDRPDILVPDVGGLNRRKLHLEEMDRRAAETAMGGPSPGFLFTLDMKMVLRRATPADFDRVAELMVRTNQLNTTGRVVPPEELRSLCASNEHLALVADLRDRFGDYGTVAFALVTRAPDWTLSLLCVSCRVRDRGVGAAILDALMQSALHAGAALRAEFVHTERNRHMYVALKLAGFEEVGGIEPVVLLQAQALARPRVSPWIAVTDTTQEGLP
jgi:FkbH-like protein